MTRRLLFPLLALAIAAGIWWTTQRDAAGMGLGAGVMELCATVPAPGTYNEAMAARGWQTLADTQADDLARATALFHIASRRAGQAGFDAAAEAAQFKAFTARALESFAQEGLAAFGRADSPAMAVIAPVEGLPNAVGCEIYLPGDEGRMWFDTLTAPHDTSSDRNGWASASYTDGQLPRPGLWVANLAVITPDDELTAFLGENPALTVLSRTAFRGEMPQ